MRKPYFARLAWGSALALLLAGGLTLGACVHDGGGDDEPVTEMPEPMPEPEEPKPTSNVTIPDAMYLNAANMPMAGMVTIPAGGTHTSGGVTFSCPAGGDDCELNVMANGSVTSTGGEATAMLTEAAMEQVADTKLMYRDRIIGLDRALETAANFAQEGAIEITRGSTGTASVALTGYSPSDETVLPNGNWHGSRLTQTSGSATNRLVVYTDKEPAERIQFYNWDGDATTPSRYANATADTLSAPADASFVITAMSIGGTGQPAFSTATADLTKFPKARTPAEGSFTQTYRINDAATLGGTIDRVSIPGNYNGAGGRYLCTPSSGSMCSVTVAPSGAYTTNDTWTFEPELNSTAWLEDGGTAQFGANARQVGDFMHFGWWLQDPTLQTGPFAFRYYASGTPYNNEPDGSAINLAAGSATYNGRAAGAYVVQNIDDTGVTGGTAGQFVAAARLTATFSGTGAGGTIEGMISGFQGEYSDISGWSVALNQQPLASGATVTSAGTQNDPTASGFHGATAVMGDQTAYGTWVSQFFGQPTHSDLAADAYPLGVGGTFQADNEHASIAGSFGARR